MRTCEADKAGKGGDGKTADIMVGAVAKMPTAVYLITSEGS